MHPFSLKKCMGTPCSCACCMACWGACLSASHATRQKFPLPRHNTWCEPAIWALLQNCACSRWSGHPNIAILGAWNLEPGMACLPVGQHILHSSGPHHSNFHTRHTLCSGRHTRVPKNHGHLHMLAVYAHWQRGATGKIFLHTPVAPSPFNTQLRLLHFKQLQ